MLYGPKMHVDANSRANVRVTPLRAEKHQPLVEMAHTCFLPKQAGIPEGDMYFIFHGGKGGNQVELLRPFQGMTKVVRTFYLFKDEDSVTKRFDRKRVGVGTFQLHEQLHVVCAQLPALKPHKYDKHRALPPAQ